MHCGPSNQNFGWSMAHLALPRPSSWGHFTAGRGREGRGKEGGEKREGRKRKGRGRPF